MRRPGFALAWSWRRRLCLTLAVVPGLVLVGPSAMARTVVHHERTVAPAELDPEWDLYQCPGGWVYPDPGGLVITNRTVRNSSDDTYERTTTTYRGVTYSDDAGKTYRAIFHGFYSSHASAESYEFRYEVHMLFVGDRGTLGSLRDVYAFPGDDSHSGSCSPYEP